jgi:hypothetical protein
MNPKFSRISLVFLTLVLVTLACGLFNGEEPPPVTPTQQSEEQPAAPPPTDEPEAPTDMPEQAPKPEVPLGEAYRSQEGGFEFRPLLDYDLEESFGLAAMIAPNGNPDSGPAIIMIGEATDDEHTLDEFYEAQMSEISSEQVAFSAPRDVIIAGKPGRSVDLNGTADDDVAVIGKLSFVLVSPKQTWILLGVAPVDRWEDFWPLVEAVEASVNFFEPEIEMGEQVVPGVPDEALGEEFTSVDGGYTLRVIEGFEVDEMDGNTYMTAPDSDPEAGPMIAMLGAPLDEDTTLDALYQTQIANFSSDGEMTLSEPYDDLVDGAPGLTVDISGTTNTGISVAGEIIIVLVNPRQMFIMGTVAPADQWDEFAAIYQAVKSSVSFARPTGEEIRQWATFAYASSSYDDPDWSAVQAAGAPDVPTGECVDHENAWAPEQPDTLEWLELVYDTPVIPTEINILQTHSPDQVVQVEVFGVDSEYHEVYSGVPQNLWDECPYTLSIPVEVDYGVVGVRITIDQSVIDTTWNEIDAVELVGLPLDGAPKSGGEFGSSGGTLALQDPPEPSNEAGQVNQRLLELGYEICDPSDFFSPQTEGAVKEFQRINSLEASGAVDSATWDLLFSEAALPADDTAQELVFSEPLEGVTGDKLASSGSLLWVLSRGFNFIEAYDTDTGEYAGIFSLETRPGEENYTPQAIAYDESRLWVASQGDGDAIVQAYGPSADPTEGIMKPLLEESIYLDDVLSIRGLSFDGQRLWMAFESAAYPSGIAYINRLSNQVSFVFEYGPPEQYVSAPVFDRDYLWAAFEGVVMGDAIMALNNNSGAVEGASGFCGYHIAHDLTALWVAKEYEVLAVDPYGGGMVFGRATFESRITDMTFSGARIYLLFEDGTVRFYQVF